MKNKKGFTLVELLAVIVILALLITIAVPGTRSISKRLKNKMYCSKLDFIETAATLYGEDHRDNFDLTNQKEITVKELVDTKYLKKDQENSPYIQDPRNKKSTNLYNQSLTIYLKNNRVNVSFNNSNDAKNCGKNTVSTPDAPEIPDIIVKLKPSTGYRIKIENYRGVDYIYRVNVNDNYLIDSLDISHGATAEVVNNKILRINYKGVIAKEYRLISAGLPKPISIGQTYIDYRENDLIYGLLSGISCTNCDYQLRKGEKQITIQQAQAGQPFGLSQDYHIIIYDSATSAPLDDIKIKIT